MKLKKGLLIAVFLFAVLLSGCGSSDYERDSSEGEIKQITLSQMDTMITQGKSFAVMLTTTYCGYCQDFHMLLNEYLKDHHVIMYEVVLDLENATESENLAIINRHIKDFSTTPGVFYIKDGKEKSHLLPDAQGIHEQLLDEWVVENQLDQKE